MANDDGLVSEMDMFHKFDSAKQKGKIGMGPFCWVILLGVFHSKTWLKRGRFPNFEEHVFSNRWWWWWWWWLKPLLKKGMFVNQKFHVGGSMCNTLVALLCEWRTSIEVLQWYMDTRHQVPAPSWQLDECDSTSPSWYKRWRPKSTSSSVSKISNSPWVTVTGSFPKPTEWIFHWKR